MKETILELSFFKAIIIHMVITCRLVVGQLWYACWSVVYAHYECHDRLTQISVSPTVTIIMSHPDCHYGPYGPLFVHG